MFEITGRILTIVEISPKSAQIILKKQVKGKQTAIAIDVWGFWKEKMDALKLRKNEKVQGRVYVKSNLYKGKWYTDLYFQDVQRYVPKPKWNPDPDYYKKKQETPLFDDEEPLGQKPAIDEETGEILF